MSKPVWKKIKKLRLMSPIPAHFLERARARARAGFGARKALGALHKIPGRLAAPFASLPGSIRDGVFGLPEALRGAKRAVSAFLLDPRTIICALIAAGFMSISVTAVQGYFTAVEEYQAGFGTVVLVDQEEMGFFQTEELEWLDEFLADLEATARRSYNLGVHRNESISLGEDWRPGEHMDAEALKDDLWQRLSFSATGYVLRVEGKELFTLASREDYEDVLQIVSSAYVRDRNDARVLEVDIREDIDCLVSLVHPEDMVSVEDAANILLTGTTRRETYLVSRGDSLWSIARSNNMSLSALQSANPHVQGTMIRPGDQLSLIVAEPIVNVSVMEEVAAKERIPFKTSYTTNPNMWRYQTRVLTPGKAGEKEVTYQITMENGKEIERIMVSETIIREPVTQIVARGTAKVPSLGTGRFAWPLQSGRGTITSPFGMRWGRMHNGVDIAAPTGTAILASDSGIVSFSGYRSSYGNLVILEHGNGYSTYYAHNSRNLVKQGQEVTKGSTIALMGMTGFATGPHVHFEIRYNGNPLDPMKFFRP